MIDDIRRKVLQIAIAEIGTREITGHTDNPRIVEYHQATLLKATDDETPWCSAFANWCMHQAGLPGTNNAMARSWLKWGVSLTEPVPGCIVVLKRGAPPSGHVGFFLQRTTKEGFILVLGGNQSDQVGISTFNAADVLGYRWIQEV